MLFRRVLIPLDGSTAADYAVHRLVPVLRRERSDVMLVHVAPGRAAATPDWLRRLGERLSREGVPHRSVVALGPRAPSILAEARQHGSTLVALVTHNRSGTARWLRASVTERLLAACPVPVLVFPPPTAVENAHQPRDEPDFLRGGPILVPVLVPSPVRQGLDEALRIGDAFGLPTVLLRIIAAGRERTGFPTSSYLRGLAAALSLDRPRSRVESLVEHGEPAAAIGRAARLRRAGLICLESPGRGGGGLPARLLRDVDAPLLHLRTAG